MILINLLPTEYRVTEQRMLKIPFKLIGIGVFCVFVALSIYNLFIGFKIRQENRDLNAQWERIAEPSRQADMLQRELGASVMAEIEFYDNYVDPKLEVARVMNIVSDLIPKSVTLSSVSLERQGQEFKLILAGMSESTSRDSKLIEIQNFANALKATLEGIFTSEVDEIPKAIGKLSPMPMGMPGMGMGSSAKKAVKTEVTTTSGKSSGDRALTEFIAILVTDLFQEQKK